MFTKESAVERLAKKSSLALGIFNKTLSELAQLNEEIQEEVADREARIAALTKEKNDLQLMKNENDYVKEKISKIIVQ